MAPCSLGFGEDICWQEGRLAAPHRVALPRWGAVAFISQDGVCSEPGWHAPFSPPPSPHLSQFSPPPPLPPRHQMSLIKVQGHCSFQPWVQQHHRLADLFIDHTATWHGSGWAWIGGKMRYSIDVISWSLSVKTWGREFHLPQGLPLGANFLLRKKDRFLEVLGGGGGETHGN